MRVPVESLRIGAVFALILVVVVSGLWFGLAVALLVLAATALLLGIALVWTSVQNLTGESPLSLEEALTLGSPSAEEEQKRAVLRALKDLEYERSVGKISPEDYRELSARYRAQAILLMQKLDESLAPERKRAEKLLRERLEQEGLAGEGAVESAAAEPPQEEPAPPVPADEEPAPSAGMAAEDEEKSRKGSLAAPGGESAEAKS